MDHAVTPVGHVLDGRYRVEEKIGEGGMGVVLAARHIRLGQRVAIKLMHPDADPVWQRRFVREARAASCIDSDHIARVFDVGLTEEGAPFLAMELLEGRDLAAVMYDDGPLPIEDALTYAIQACRALSAAHERGIVHRDVKPANLFLTTRDDGTPCIKLLDFGISKRQAEVGALTSTHAVLGSPQFMSPEQLSSCRDVDARADVWSLGATLFELLTLEHVFEGASLAELCTAIMRDCPRELCVHRPDAPLELEDLIASCLEKDVGLRIQSARELESQLLALRDLPLSLRPTLTAPPSSGYVGLSSTLVIHEPESLDHTPAPSVRPVVANPTVSPLRHRRGRSRSRLAVAAFVGLLGFAIAIETPAPPAAPILSMAPAAALAEVTPAPRVETWTPAPITPAPTAAPSTPPRMDTSRFSDSGSILPQHKRAIENELAKARAALVDRRIARARTHVVSALTRLRGVGIRPNEGVSSLGARATLLRGEVEGAALHALLERPIRHAEAKVVLPRIERQLMKAQIAYQLVRGWGVPSFYRCAVVESANLQLALGRAYAEARSQAAQPSHAAWMVKAAAGWTRKARAGFRTALRVPAETTLCNDRAKRGLRDAKELSNAVKASR